MFADQLSAAVDACPPLANHLANLSRDVWRSWSSGSITDDDAQRLAVRLHDRRQRGIAGYLGARNNEPTVFPVARFAFPKRRIQQSPDRRRSIERRRRLAASGGLPPALAARFTISEQAVLRIVADEVRAHGCCALHIDAIAARSGTSRSTVQRALREAQALGLLVVQERRRAGQKSLTNIVRVIMAEWRAWLRLSDKGQFSGGGFTVPNTNGFKPRSSSVFATSSRGTVTISSISPRSPVP